ncbi:MULTISPECIES: glycosyltransferase family 4 protein [unclassified Providencia]|uniref:glycosyltransferase family 4 protein n=1 Tax=unclassified Providencia TaxID=2633465 RepID=UPI00298F6CCB|nr:MULTISPECIES: glycosyltransferase family 4 protein [unclassified Providencia]
MKRHLKRKVLIISDEFPPIIGGAGIVAEQLHNDLIELGHDVDIFIPCLKQSLFFKKFWPFFYFKLINKISSYDKVIVNDIRSAYFTSLLRWVNFTKFVYIIHGTEYDIAYNPSIKNKLILLPYFYNYFLRKCGRIISVSSFTKNTFIENSNIREKIKNKIIVSYAGVKNNIGISGKYIEKRNDDFFKLVSVSRLEERKGYYEMLDIFSALVKKIPNIQWFIYGNGTIKEKLVKKVHDMNLSSKIFFMNTCDRKEIYSKEFYQHNFDLFWLLPNKPEAFGLVYIEAASIGVPVLGIEKYGIKESVNGLFFSTTNELINLILDIKINKEKYIKESIKFSKKFDSKFFANSILYEEHEE